MAEKRNFLISKDLLHSVKQIPKELAGEFFIKILNFANGIEDEEESNPIVNILFAPVKEEMTRNESSYDQKCNKNKETIQNYWNNLKGVSSKKTPPAKQNGSIPTAAGHPLDVDAFRVQYGGESLEEWKKKYEVWATAKRKYEKGRENV